MQRNEGESPEGIGGMTSNPWNRNSREGGDSNTKVPCIGRGYMYFLELYINRNDKKSIVFMRALVKIAVPGRDPKTLPYRELFTCSL